MGIKLGDKVKDSITGFEGLATAITTWANGCVRVEVTSAELHDGKPIEGQWFDEQRLTEEPVATSGGSRSAPPSRDPTR